MSTMTSDRDRAVKPPQPDTDELGLRGWFLPRMDYPSYRLMLVAKIMDRISARNLATVSALATAEWRALSRLANSPEGGTIKQLAEFAWVDRAEVSRAISTLIRDGYAKKRENPRDLRAPIISITAKGRKKYEKVVRLRAEFHEFLLVGIDEKERLALDEILAKIAKRLVLIGSETRRTP